MDQLDAAARDLVARYKESLGPSANDSAMNWQAIAAQAQAESDVADRRRSARRAFGLGALVATIAAAAAIVVVFTPWEGRSGDGEATLPSAQYDQQSDRATGGDAIQREPAADPPVRRRRRAVIPDAEPAAEPTADAGEADPFDDEIEIEVETPSKSKPRRTPAASPADPLSALREEADLVRRARAALATGRAHKALSLASEHAKRFKGGSLTEEIATIRVGALCEVGPAKRWRKALDSFAARYPGSPLRVHLREDCFE